MKVYLVAFITVTVAVAFTEAAAVYSPLALPYAIGHPYLSTPFISLPSPAASLVELKHHTPEHTLQQQLNQQPDEEKKEENKKEETDKLKPQLPVVYNLYPYSSVPIAVVSPLSAPGTQSQYRVQDELGQYQYGYSSPLSAKNEIKTLDGITRGAYSYIDSNGELQAVNYVADALGFRVLATNVPEQVKPVEIPDAPEVAEAKAKLFALQQEHIAKVKAAAQESEKFEPVPIVAEIIRSPAEFEATLAEIQGKLARSGEKSNENEEKSIEKQPVKEESVKNEAELNKPTSTEAKQVEEKNE